MLDRVRGRLRYLAVLLPLAALSIPAAYAQSADDKGDEREVIERTSASDRTVELGQMLCVVQPNTRRNYIIRSTAQVNCEFTPLKGEKEMYKGVTGIQLGIDLTVREDDELRFAVLSSYKKGEERPKHALSGKYFGASATASITYGLGVAALVGGSGKKISLQPLGLQALRGLGLGAGLGYLYLEPMEAS